jgi:hypothetical protein
MDNPSTGSELVVEYGDNMEGSAFEQQAQVPWNLQTLPEDESSALRHLQHAIPGINSPMLYHGMVFSTFCWHVEDVYLHSINYHHAGAPKIWYGVAARFADQFEAIVKDQVSTITLKEERHTRWTRLQE